MQQKLRPILLAGGSGTRLWPLSTEERPKQFIPIFKGLSLFDLTLKRLNNNPLFKRPIIVTSEKYLNHINNSLNNVGVDAAKIILEPEQKNTYSAITMAVMLATKEDSTEIFFIAPSDHYISSNKSFYDSCHLAKDSIDDNLILLGVKPELPSSEYGYLKTQDNNNIKKVIKFIEKPDLKTSKELISSKGVYWNSGMFMFSGSWFLDRLKKSDEIMFVNMNKIISGGHSESNFFYPNVSLFSNLNKISFDHAFVENCESIIMAELNAGWSDLGSWISFGKFLIDSDNSMNFYGGEAYTRCNRPWGYFETIMETENSKVKLISVSPSERLSLQKHQFRSETWHIVKGEAKVTKGRETFTMKVGDNVIIDIDQVHRLENESNKDLVVIEIQTGTYFGEDDIVRLEDTYGRSDLHQF